MQSVALQSGFSHFEAYVPQAGFLDQLPERLYEEVRLTAHTLAELATGEQPVSFAEAEQVGRATIECRFGWAVGPELTQTVQSLAVADMTRVVSAAWW